MGEQHPEKARLPTPLVALLLCGFSVLQAMAAAASKEGGEYPYKVVASTLLSEVFKIALSALCLAREVWGAPDADRRRALYFTTKTLAAAAVPGVAYQVLNNLNFVTLYYVDAPTFQILGNLKIVATGLAGRYLLKRKLDTGRWLALVLLTLGAASSQVAPDCAGDGAAFLRLGDRAYGYASAVACVGLSATIRAAKESDIPNFKGSDLGRFPLVSADFWTSDHLSERARSVDAFPGTRARGTLALNHPCAAQATMGVFTEAFMKGTRSSIHFQNMQLYAFGIAANLAALLYRGEVGAGASPLFAGFNVWGSVATVANGCCGLAVSFMLRYADSIAKTYASALTIPATAAASYACFGTPVGAASALGSGVMLASLAFFYGGADLFAPPDAGKLPGAADR